MRPTTRGLSVLLLVPLLAARPSTPERVGVASAQEAPRLVVLVVVDQLPASLLDRYDTVFTGGFRRLLDGGLRFTNATHDHAVTETAPGHATIATGTEPRRHGVVSNEWWEPTDGPEFDLVLNVIDRTEPVLGEPTLAGASPAPLERSGLADWLQADSPESRVVSVSGKDRGAVLLATHSRAEVFWFAPELGRFVTSTHYADQYPDWVTEVNEDVVAGFAGDTVWSLAVPEELRGLAERDDRAGEADGVHVVFPHSFGQDRTGNPELPFWAWWAGTPGPDAITLALAERALEEVELGADEVPDLLAISLSQTDRVGHAYGPESLEQLDNLLRLDRELGRFLDRLDERVGEGNHLVVLTSDHGALALPETRAERGLPGGRLTRDSVAALQTLVNKAASESSGPADRAERLAETVVSASWVYRAWTHAELAEVDASADSFTVLHAKGYHPDRFSGLLSRAGVEMQLGEGVLTWSIPKGTTHGSAWFYDRHVPWIVYGAGVPSGVREEAVSMADVAPTVAAVLGVPVPDDLDGVDRGVGRSGA